MSMPKSGKGSVGEVVRKYQWNKAGQSGLSSDDTPGPRKSFSSFFLLFPLLIRWWQRRTDRKPSLRHR